MRERNRVSKRERKIEGNRENYTDGKERERKIGGGRMRERYSYRQTVRERQPKRQIDRQTEKGQTYRKKDTDYIYKV